METDGLMRTELSGSVMCEMSSRLCDILHEAYVEGTHIDIRHPIFDFPCKFVIISEIVEASPNGAVVFFELRSFS